MGTFFRRAACVARRPVALVALVVFLSACAAQGGQGGGVGGPSPTGAPRVPTLAEQRARAQEFDAQLQARFPRIEDRAVVGYVEGIIARLQRTRPAGAGPVRLRIIDVATPNAFTLGFGIVYMTSGLIAMLENEAQLASVMAHEMAHLDLDHPRQRFDAIAAAVEEARQTFAELDAAGRTEDAEATRLIVNIAFRATFTAFAREDEFEADAVGASYLAAAGYPSSAAAAALARMRATVGESRTPTWLSTHPPTAERIAALNEATRGNPGGRRLGRRRHAQAAARLAASGARGRSRAATVSDRPRRRAAFVGGRTYEDANNSR